MNADDPPGIPAPASAIGRRGFLRATPRRAARLVRGNEERFGWEKEKEDPSGLWGRSAGAPRSLLSLSGPPCAPAGAATHAGRYARLPSLSNHQVADAQAA